MATWKDRALERVRHSLTERAFVLLRPEYRHGRISWAQEGEDLILARLLSDKQKGFYVDVGAHHPHRFSNTQYFYARGWRGINIDATPGSMELFDRHRPRDKNLEVAVGAVSERKTLHQFAEPALNTLSAEDAALLVGRGIRPITETPVQVSPLSALLEEHVPPDTAIDFLTVDIEGSDVDALRSNNWDLFRPACVVIERRALDIGAAVGDVASLLMSDLGYVLQAKTMNSLFYVSRQG